jgi:hypothetical protein
VEKEAEEGEEEEGEAVMDAFHRYTVSSMRGNLY